MIAELIISNGHMDYISFFIFQAAFIMLGVGSIIFLKFIFRKIVSITTGKI